MKIINKSDSSYIQYLVKNGGPSTEQYGELNLFFNRLGDMVRSANASREQINIELWQLLGDAVSINTMQGKVVIKPYGYAGDFELIDNIYTTWISPDPLLANWDYFFHSQAATKAVKNRKTYFINLLKCLERNSGNRYSVLNVGSGPARDVMEFFSNNRKFPVTFDCIDMDSNAISYSKTGKIIYFLSIIFDLSMNINYHPWQWQYLQRYLHWIVFAWCVQMFYIHRSGYKLRRIHFALEYDRRDSL